MSITWSKYFDKIYCLHFIPHTNLMEQQLNRIGILDSGIFEWQYIFDNYLNKKFNSYIQNNIFNKQIGDAIDGHYEIIRNAYFRGYKNILILEDNEIFLDDLNKIEQILENKQKDNIISYNKNNPKGCYQLDKTGMKKMIDLLETQPAEINNYFKHAEEYFKDIKYSYSSEDIIKQNIQIDQIERKDLSKDIKITEDLNFNLDDQVQPAILNICFAVTNNHVDKLNTAIYSFKKYTNKNSKLNFYIVTDTDKFEKFEQQVQIFRDDRASFKFADCSDIIKSFNPKFNHFHTFVSYMPMFLPTIFPDVDKILYMDYDTVINRNGIENLFNLNIEEYYFAGVMDNLFLKNGFFSFHKNIYKEYNIFKHVNKQYINSGVLLINSKKIREDGKIKEVVQLLKQEPPTNFNDKTLQDVWMQTESRKLHPSIITFQLTDQSVLNWIFNDKVKIVSPIFNNLLGFMNNICYQKELKLWGFENYDDFFDKSIVYHINKLKPWQVVPENKWNLNKFELKAIQRFNDIRKEMKEVLK